MMNRFCAAENGAGQVIFLHGMEYSVKGGFRPHEER